MKFLLDFKLFEIASIVEPNIVRSEPGLTESYFEFKVGEDTYIVYILLNNMYDEEILSIIDLNTIEISFDLGNNSYKLSNKNIPLKVLSNLVGVIKHWSSLDISEDINEQEMNLKDVNITHIRIESKREAEDDFRRSNIYNYYIEKFINSIIINKKSEKKIGSNTIIPIRKFEVYETTYEIEPTNVRNLIKE